jgi:hypothetical protein
VPPAEKQVLAFLPSVGNLVFLLFDGKARALLLSVTEGVLGFHALWGGKSGTSRLARPRAWGSLGFVVAGSWHCVGSRLELSGAQAAVALGSTCTGV